MTREFTASRTDLPLRVSRFPFPPHGRIPNCAGADLAAAQLFEIEPRKSATAIKVTPDSPQRPLRARRCAEEPPVSYRRQIAWQLQEARSARYSPDKIL